MENNQDKKTEFEDVYSDSSKKPTYKKGHKPLEERDIFYPNKFIEFLLKNNKRNTKIILAAMILVMTLMIAALVAVFINDKLEMINYDDEGWTGDENFSEDFEENEFDAMHDVSDAASLDDLLKKWYNLEGSIMDQDYVINVLLLGIDGKNGVKYGGNSDSMILVSINKKTEKITLVSFMRDSRSYFNVNGREYWQKMNAAYSRGGAAATVRTIENNYKVDIDYYVAVDFTTFPELVDALGGVTLDIEQYEQKYINRTTSKIKKIPNYGTVTLDGDQALVYCRIRKSDADSDVSRTRRQRNFISALIRSAKGASIGQLNGAVDTVLPHLSTDCPKSKILGFAAQALSQGWMNYEIVQLTMPDQETRADANFNGVSYWVADYPLAAQKVQTAIYGTSNIELDENRESALDYVRYSGNGSSGNSGSSNSGGSGEDSSFAEQTTVGNEVAETTTRNSLFPGWPWGGDEETTASDSGENSGEETTAPTDGGDSGNGEQNTTSASGSEEDGGEEQTTSGSIIPNPFRTAA